MIEKNKIIVLGIDDLNSQLEERLYLIEFKKMGYNIEYINYYSYTKEEIEKKIREFSGIIFIYYDLNKNYLEIYKMLFKLNKSYFYFDNMVTDEITLLMKIKRYINNGIIKKILEKLKIKYYLKVRNICEKRIVFSSNNNGNNNKTYKINNMEIERILRRKKKNIFNYKYMVFIDQYFPFHSDNNLIFKGLDYKEYYIKLEEFFNSIDKKGYKVIISGHPKAKRNFYSSKFLYFENSTVELIMGAEKVLTHYSLARNIAFLLKKEVCLIYSNQFYNIDSFYLDYMKFLSKKYNLKLVNIEEENEKFLREIHSEKNIKKRNKTFKFKTSFYKIEKIIKNYQKG